MSNDLDRKKAWEYELEMYRKKKRNEKFYLFGSICGIISLIFTLILNSHQIIGFFVENIF